MRTLNNKDLALMERLMLGHQAQTRKFLAQVMKKYYKKEDLIMTKDYIVAKGDIPIAVAAHMDTVWETSVGHEVFYDERKNVMVNLNGGGYDDKVGIFMILKILERGLRPHVIFCADEEIGSLGAEKLVEDYPIAPFNDCRFIVMLDRRGLIDCVFYDCDNDDFVEYVEKFGFKEAFGSFTDICTLCPVWGMAGVNLSVGYENEHTVNEKLYVAGMYATLEKTINILSQDVDEIPYFKFIPSQYSFRYGWHTPRYAMYDYSYYDEVVDLEKDATYGEGGWFYPEDDEDYCQGCGKQIRGPEDGVETILTDYSKGYYCWDCAGKHVNYCELCGEAFEVDPAEPDRAICPDCYLEITSGKWGY